MVGRRHGLRLATFSEKRRAREGKDEQMNGFIVLQGDGRKPQGETEAVE